MTLASQTYSTWTVDAARCQLLEGDCSQCGVWLQYGLSRHMPVMPAWDKMDEQHCYQFEGLEILTRKLGKVPLDIAEAAYDGVFGLRKTESVTPIKRMTERVRV